jgi:hypothetical protein
LTNENAQNQNFGNEVRGVKIEGSCVSKTSGTNGKKGKFSLDSRWCALCDSNTSKKFEVIEKQSSSISTTMRIGGVKGSTCGGFTVSCTAASLVCS